MLNKSWRPLVITWNNWKFPPRKHKKGKRNSLTKFTLFWNGSRLLRLALNMERWTSPNWTSGTPIISILLTTPVETEGWLILSSLLKFQGSNSLCIWCNHTNIWRFTIWKHWKIVLCNCNCKRKEFKLFQPFRFFKCGNAPSIAMYVCTKRACKYIRQVRVGKDCPWIKKQNVTFTAIQIKFYSLPVSVCSLPNKSSYMHFLAIFQNWDGHAHLYFKNRLQDLKKNSFFLLGFYEFLAMLEGKIRNGPFFHVSMF